MAVWKKRVNKYNAGLSNHQYNKGDLILYQNYAKKNKPGVPWLDKWRGPAEIVKMSGNTR